MCIRDRFRSNVTEFHVTLWNLNYEADVVKEANDDVKDVVKEVVKEALPYLLRTTRG